MKKVLLIYGGVSSEHDVSCKSAKAIIDNIDTKKYILDCVKVTQENIWLNNDKPIDNIIDFLKKYDVVFPIIHGTNGEDGKLQGLLELYDIKYVGSKLGPSYICMDKERTKQILNNHDILQVPYQIYQKKEKIKISFPLIVKPANGGSSIGISIINNKKELTKAINIAKKYDDKIILEKYLSNPQELECAILENGKLIVSDIGEIIHDSSFYDYDTKYKNNNTKTIIPANLDNKKRKEIKKIAEKVFKILELKNLARIDFFYHDNKIYLNEINTLPGFTEISMYPQLIMNENITYKDLISILIENA